MPLNDQSTLEDVAAIVSDALTNAGIVATLSGGGAVSIYSDNEYESKDLDFVTASSLKDLKPVMEGLGFEHTGTGHLSEFKHPEVEWYIEFVPAPITFGNLTVSHKDCISIKLEKGELRIVTPTQSVMDRLAAVFHWNDPQSRDQALKIAARQNIDWDALKVWFLNEGQSEEDFQKFQASSGNI
jgi:hypothetical protein